MKSYSIDKNKNTRILADFKKNEQYQRCTELRGQLLEIKDKMRIYKDQYKRKQEELLLLMEQLPNLIHPSVKGFIWVSVSLF
jgi:seryl-tRNA synthetase